MKNLNIWYTLPTENMLPMKAQAKITEGFVEK